MSTPTTSETGSTVPSNLQGQQPQLQASLKTPEMKRILASSFIGSAVEYYDFLLYATASAIVFNKVFFINMPPAMATFASFATFAVGYLARPLGGALFGHWGDRVGRKKMLVISMLTVGFATMAIGILPTTATIGIAAPIILTFIRLIQGIAVGGEWGGAALMALEHAPKEKRGFATSFATAGGPAGAILATLALSAASAFTGDNFLTWGWRIPFLFSAVLVVVGLVIRLKVSESPLFKGLEKAGSKRKIPLVEVFTNHPRAVAVALIVSLGFAVTQGLMTVWGVAVATESGADRTGVLNWKAAAALVNLTMTFASARLSDRYGRRAVMATAAILGMVLAYPIISMLESGSLIGFGMAIVVGSGIVQGMLFGPVGAYIAEQFPTDVRFTGASLAFQGAAALGVGLSPLIAQTLVINSGSYQTVGVFWGAVLLMVLAVLLLNKDTSKKELH
ncbi:MFS transporter [Arthrobacter sp. AQ5-05]|uniref:MFS transporter n=1 Tax=Arthrobacter sp. AQ5-05 TaxID=2184581 RepID=UPI000DCDEDBD|nr:MFS transporter [Arthrobacter sp. AQ5-05]RAX48274.1 MFS transporter [Arthrobacter sp. AQ5-05]